MAEVIINDSNFHLHQTFTCPITGETKGKGCTKRDYNLQPMGCSPCASPFNIPLIPQSEQQDRLNDLKANKAQLSDIRNISGPNQGPIPSRDQDGKGYCWAHSSVSAALIARAKENQPYADLSAFAVACIIKDYADEGGNGIDSLEFIANRGVPTSEFWPQQSMSRSNDNPQTWANAALHKYIQWMELSDNSSERQQQLITCLLLGMPIVSDFDWWSHSVCTIDLVSISPFQTRIWNSWGDSWSENGTGILEGSKALPDNAIAAMIITASES